jgi:hypothetical protein
MNNAHHLTVRFDGAGIPAADQGPLLLHLEREARRFSGKPIEVFKEIMADDSKLRLMGEKRRRDMTEQEREQL